MKITKIAGGPLPTNCYLLTEETSGETAVIDPGFESSELTKAVLAKGKENVKAILLTHGHFDHIMGVSRIQELTGAKVYIYSDDVMFPNDNSLNMSTLIFSNPVPSFTADVTLNDGDEIRIGSLTVRVLHTPGHTIGGCCYMVENAIFTGDTLMKCSCGRTDFPTGSYPQMLQSLSKLKKLEGDYHIYPGHESESTLEYERKNNPYMSNAAYDFNN